MLLNLIKNVEEKDGDTDHFSFAILNNEQMAYADRYTIESGTQGYDLMMSAGQAVANIVHQHYLGYSVLVLCGPGNNGGDGFVAAGFLTDMGFDVSVMSLVPKRKFKGDASQAVQDWKKSYDGKILGFKNIPEMPEKTVVIDALFGTGLSKPLDNKVVKIFEHVQSRKWPVVAVDIPSGVNGNTGEADEHTLPANHTVTFFKTKLGHMLMPGLELCGEISVHDIGIDENVLKKTGLSALENKLSLWEGHFPHRKAGDHKYTKGHVVILGGKKMTGAARLAAQAAMKMGAGLCTIASDPKSSVIYQTEMPHILNEVIQSYDDFLGCLDDPRKNVVLMGPGLGQDDQEDIRQLILNVLKTDKSIVLDADALTCFENHTEEFFALLTERCILTPHEGEFRKLFGNLSGTKLEQAEQAAKLCGANILFKGADTILSSPNPDHSETNIVKQRSDYSVINTHATPWLATAGAGDVLAGIIAALCGQGMKPFDAMCTGAWIHGESALKYGPGLTAPDIIEEIPSILYEIA